MRKGIIVAIIFVIAVVCVNLGNSFLSPIQEGLVEQSPIATGTSASAPPKSEQLQYNSYDQQKSCAFLGEKNAANIAYLKEQLDGFSKIQQQMAKLKEDVDKNSAALDEIGEELSKKSTELTGRSADDKSPLPTASGLNPA